MSANVERSRLITSTANRLRMIQIDFADEEPAVREQFLAEALQAALDEIPTHERGPFLEGLEDRFPTWDAQVQLANMDGGASTRSESDTAALNDISFVLDRLIELSRGKDEKVRQTVRDRLAMEGLSESRHGIKAPEEILAELAKSLGVREASSMDTARALEVGALALKLVAGLDGVAWPAWKQMSRGLPPQASSSLRKDIGRYAIGKTDVSREKVEQGMDQLRRLVAALVSALSGGTRVYGQEHIQNFAPDRIAKLVEREGGGGLLGKSVDHRCWAKYQSLAGDLDAEKVRADILQAMAKFASESMGVKR